ncbi:MAG: cytochrome P450 [Frankia sp.]
MTFLQIIGCQRAGPHPEENVVPVPSTVASAPSTVLPGNAAPGPPAGIRSMLRTLRGMTGDRLTFVTQMQRTYGPIVRIPAGKISAFLISDPDSIKEILVTSKKVFEKGTARRERDGSQVIDDPLSRVLGKGLLTSTGTLHRNQRRLMQPLFHRQRIEAYGSTFVDLTRTMTAGWVAGSRIDVHQEMTELTLAIVAQTLFDAGIDSEVARVVRTALVSSMEIGRIAQIQPGGFLERLPVPSIQRARRSREALDRVVVDLIRQRRTSGSAGSDLLSLLTATQDADSGAVMDDTQVRDEAMTLLLAGHETTSNALCWTFHLLGQNQDARATLHAELDAVLEGRPATVDDLPRLAWTNAVFSESMRLYPPVWAIGRHLLVDHELCGYLLPAGATVFMCPWVVHRDPGLWPEALSFAPSRWLPGQTDPNRPRNAYFPFGGGSRQCIGNNFAHMEGVLALATIAQNWTLEPVPGVTIEPEPLLTLRPRGGLPMVAHLRR